MDLSARLPAALAEDVVEAQNSQASKRSRVTPQEYIDAVACHAKQSTLQSLHPGLVLEDLALFLKESPAISTYPDGKDVLQKQTSSIATLYTMGASRKRQSFANANECAQALQPDKTQPRSHILFLKGYSSPEWLSSIGSLCRTDPEYFNSHLQFRCRRDYFSSPSLPSSSDNIIKLKFVTIGCREAKHGGSDQVSVDRLRRNGSKAMHIYEHGLMIGADIKRGDSIVRKYAVLDEKHFVIEQEMSLCLCHIERDWIILVCTDAGNDLSEGPHGPWLRPIDRDSLPPWTIFYPTIQRRPRISLRSEFVSCSDKCATERRFPQSATLLAEDYGKLLDPEVMTMDPFFAVHDLFSFSAFSEVQFLNLMEAKVKLETGHSSLLKEKPTLSNLLYYQELIDAHLLYLRATVEVIKCQGGLRWPHVPEQNRRQHEKAKTAAESLLRDFEHLVQRAESLLSCCTKGMNVIMNDVNLAESKRAISQAQGVAKLTLIAFFYIPLSFMTSFFGMNFAELGNGTLSLWIWFAASIPIFIISVSFLLFDFRKLTTIGKKAAQLLRSIS